MIVKNRATGKYLVHPFFYLELGAFLAERFSTRSRLSVLMFDAFAVRAIVLVVIHVAMLRRILFGTGVISGYRCHIQSPLDRAYSSSSKL